MTLPTGYRLRSPAPSDLEAVAGVVMAGDLADDGWWTRGVDFVREQWSRVHFDPVADAWVAVDRTGTALGYGQAHRDAPGVVECWGVVHPAHRGRGIGSAVLDRIEARAAELMAGRPSYLIAHVVNASDRTAKALLRDRGLEPVHHFWHMQIDLPGRAARDRMPEGVDITRIAYPADLPAVHAVIAAAFAGVTSRDPEPFDRWAVQQRRSPSFDPSLWLLAIAESQPVGTLMAQVWDDCGWVSEIGVLRSHRRRGIGAALLRAVFAVFADRGLGRVLLNVNAANPTGATQLYATLGMRVVKRWEIWERSTEAAEGRV